jgi:REP element-mobilizing transposase RayT
VEKELYAYIGGVLKTLQCVPICINGIENHIHILCILSKNIALAELLEQIKGSSSKWIKTKGAEYINFAWQGGYGGFSVSQSKAEVVKHYIENQKEHHKAVSFKEEYTQFLKEYEIEYNEDYLWS